MGLSKAGCCLAAGGIDDTEEVDEVLLLEGIRESVGKVIVVEGTDSSEEVTLSGRAIIEETDDVDEISDAEYLERLVMAGVRMSFSMKSSGMTIFSTI